MNKLILELNENGEIEAKDEDTDEVIFVMPKPYMVDSKGVFSEEVNYEIIESKNYQYVIQVIADKEWLNDEDRVYPIVIDPVIKVKQQTDNESIQTTFVSKWKADEKQYGKTYCW